LTVRAWLRNVPAMDRENLVGLCRALASDKRMKVLEWLADPRAHFPPQRDGDLVEDGVCSVFIAEKLDVSQPTTSRHMKVLLQAGLVTAKAQKGWTFYRLDRGGMEAAQKALGFFLGAGGEQAAGH